MSPLTWVPAAFSSRHDRTPDELVDAVSMEVLSYV